MWAYSMGIWTYTTLERMAEMAKKRYRLEGIVIKLRQVKVLQSQGMAAVDAIIQIGMREVI